MNIFNSKESKFEPLTPAPKVYKSTFEQAKDHAENIYQAAVTKELMLEAEITNLQEQLRETRLVIHAYGKAQEILNDVSSLIPGQIEGLNIEDELFKAMGEDDNPIIDPLKNTFRIQPQDKGG